MTSEIRVNKLTNRIGLSTVTFADSGIGVTVTGRIDPDTDSARDLGTSSVRWRNVYADTLYGDGSNLTGITGTTINSNTNNYVVTATGTANTLQGESNVVINGGKLGIGVASPAQLIEVHGASNPAVLVQDTTNNCISYMYSQDSVATFGSASNHPVVFNVSNGEKVRIDTSGRLLLGNTSARSVGDVTAQYQIEGTSFSSSSLSLISNAGASAGNIPHITLGKSRGTSDGSNTVVADGDKLGIIQFAGADGTDCNTVAASIIANVDGTPGSNSVPGYLTFNTAAASAVPTERMRLNSNGSLSIANTRNYYGALNVEKTSTSSSAIDIKADGSGGSYAKAITVGDHNTIQGDWSVKNSSDVFFGTNTNHSLTFGVNNTERMRLNLHGFLKCMGDMSSHMSADGNNYHEMQADNPHIQILNMKHGSSNGYGIMMQFNHAKSTHWAFRVYSFASGTTHMFIRTDGDCENTNNSYGSISDVKLKENIVDANSQWDDIKALKVRNFNFKSSTGLPTHKQLGLVAQEAEQVCPSLIKDQPDLGEENEDLGTTTKVLKYSVLYMKAIKALQEAMAKIETLEEKVKALEDA